MSRKIGVLIRIALLSTCALCMVLFFGIFFDYRRSAMRDAESKAALKLLAKSHVEFAEHENALESYLVELKTIRNEYSGIWFIRDYVDEVQRIAIKPKDVAGK